MVLRPDVASAALADVADGRPLVCLTPRGRPFIQADAHRYAAGPGIVLLCARYEGIDQRVIEAHGMEEVSIGDYVLSGGELPALVVLDAVVRLLPGVMGAAESAQDESFAAGFGDVDFGGGPFGVRRPLRFLAHKLELEEKQVAELARILSDLKTERAQADVYYRRTTSGLASIRSA